MSDDRWAREVLHDAVSDVEPEHRLDAIRRRTRAGRPRRRTWALPAAGAAVGVAATVAVIALVTTSPGSEPSKDPGFAASPSPSRTATSAPPDTGEEQVALPVYYAGSTPTGPRLFREFHATVTGDPALSAVKAALMEPPLDPDYYSVWTEVGAEVESVTSDSDLVTIDLHTGGPAADRPSGMSAADADLAIQQLIYTVQGALQSGHDVPVEITVDGHPAQTLLGVPVNEPLAAADPMEVTSTVWITSPQDGDVVASGTTVEGRGAFFEATVSWQLLQGDRVVADGFTNAATGGTLSPYSFVLEARPGSYVLRVYDADMSEGEGPGEAEDTKRITIE